MKINFDQNNVSRETIAKLLAFQDLVLKWNKKINLISKASEQNIWERHIVDSLQLCKYIEEKDKILYDFGSGAGFPAIVIAIAAEQFFPKIHITLIESIGKKTLFLNEAKKELNLDITILQKRVENINLPPPDLITSRAMASLDKLLTYCEPFCKNNTRLILPKGEKWQEEIKEAKQKRIFNYTATVSVTNENARILVIENIRRK